MTSSAVWAALGAVIIVAATRLRVGTPGQPGPGFLPLLTGVIICALGLAVAVQEGLAQRGAGRRDRATPDASRAVIVAAAGAALLAYAVLLERAGYLLTTLAFMAFALRALGGVSWRGTAIVSVAATLVSYALFKMWLRVPLPAWPGF